MKVSSSLTRGEFRRTIDSAILPANTCVEMCESMRKVASLETEMSIEERNLLSVAYKNAVGSRRSSWRSLQSIEMQFKSSGNWTAVERVKQYSSKIESEIEQLCVQVLELIEAKVLPVTTSVEAKVFFFKL